MNKQLENDVLSVLKFDYNTTIEKATPTELYNGISKVVMNGINDTWKKDSQETKKKAFYMSAEFLMGRAITANLLNLNLLKDVREMLSKKGRDINFAENIADQALGNGGLGRLAACFLESAASINKRLDGYGIRYKYGLFKQSFDNGFQKEECDDWTSFGDPWSVRREDESVIVAFNHQKVKAVPYDMPIIGYGGETINTLRLWQSEAMETHNFTMFNNMKYSEFMKRKTDSEIISYVLYPNDETYEGKVLRLKQQYFFSSASMQDLLRKFEINYKDYTKFPEFHAVQLNDTHPVISILELIRLLMIKGVSFEKSYDIVTKTFAYTNHTVLGEALEKWDFTIIKEVLPEIYTIAEKIQKKLEKNKFFTREISIIKDNQLNMANLAIFTCKNVNGVAQLHTDILKADLFKTWYSIYPEKFLNVTNGITPRRWFMLAGEKMCDFVEETIGDGFKKDLTELKKLEKFAKDKKFIEKFKAIKKSRKKELANFILEREEIHLPSRYCFDIQIKRLHEYKRQLLSALSILHYYYEIKEGNLKDFHPIAFIFGAKSAPGYYTAKGIIKFINEIARLVNNDPVVKEYMRVEFIPNYNVSYAEMLFSSADISEQISTAGLEASGTGNMKFMLNGTVTLGTMDGANVEIVQEAGVENNYIFGANSDEVVEIKKNYDPRVLYNDNKNLKRAIDSLINGTVDDGGTGMFRVIYDSLVGGQHSDRYLICQDFNSYIDKKLEVIKEYDTDEFYTKCIMNMANAGKFSSDRSIAEYCENIWEI